ncbi:MAG: carbohydrate ABC transporter permease, partial [Maritimibacter sp.]|nr:carbohydrate ABC transporter permease [Maritimibacter sp.]
MFPRPIEQQSRAVRIGYQLALPVALVLWLLPLIGVAITSVKPASDLASGNYFGLPSYLAFSNYVDVFTGSPIGQYIWNSFKVTIPTVLGTLVLSALTGFALGIYRFRANIFIFFMFVAGNFVPFQILMVPVRDMTVNLGLYNTTTGLVLFHVAFQTGFCTLFMRNFIRALPRELIEAARVEG